MTEEENKRDLRKRTWNYARRCIRLASALPKSYLGNHFGGQLIRSSTSVATNYRAAQLAQSKAAFAAKISISLEEADESALWMEFIMATKLLPENKVQSLHDEATELVKILAQSRITATGRGKKTMSCFSFHLHSVTMNSSSLFVLPSSLALPKSYLVNHFGRQVIRNSTLVPFSYRIKQLVKS